MHILFNTGIGSSAGVRIYFYFEESMRGGLDSWTGGQLDGWTVGRVEMDIEMHLIKI